MQITRVGIGYDIHRLVSGKLLFLGGVSIDFQKGLEGHSDADVLIHAICDAILGAIGEEDLGSFFPDTDLNNKNRPSCEFLSSVMNIARKKGYSIVNLDCVVIAEEPKIKSHKKEIIKSLADIMGIGIDKINVKGKTKEKLGEVGAGDAIETYVVAMVSAMQ
ncbi:2-C-methyl-D-erythritol 2,4-cyclodiphosphate synthase [Candidatus Omnitrophus magneticus]|uniref:2-C-methyl-D-erythritol 2,4-cyclodiphosphate synthase n=1 Tax=Candidatus Omnitrophus magneticus TaxID=1609969 RepID=A0A0F0CLK7_9BACT|nr:2-C-methyl-D-erythritol 2,4-cyclodiphosphate synthase [Candidatus Omnitrophus magneticus]